MRALLSTAETTLVEPATTRAGTTVTWRSRSSRTAASACGGCATGVAVGLAERTVVVPKFGGGALGGELLICRLVARSKTYTAQIQGQVGLAIGWATHSEKKGD